MGFPQSSEGLLTASVSSKHCEDDRIKHADRDQIKQYAWKGRELGDKDLFPLERLNITHDMKGRADTVEKPPYKKANNFFCTMDNVMSSKG